MPLVVSAVARSHVGLVRSGNEDSGYAGRSLFALADGMGGHAAGEVASRTVVAALLDLDGTDLGPDPRRTLRSAVLEANERLRLAVAARPDLDGMGTTLTALAWDGHRLGLVHVGDSRAYRLREGRLTPMTKDQSLVQALIDEGRITEREARNHPQRSVILQALDGRPDIDPQVAMLEPVAGDRYLICSDGLSDVVEDADIAVGLGHTDPVAAIDVLIGLALEAGAPDNVTVVVVDVAESASAPPPDTVRDAASHEPGGVLVGAVGETSATREPAPALSAPGPASVDVEDVEDVENVEDLEDEPDEDRDDEAEWSASRRAGRRRRRWPWLLVVLAVLVVAALLAARAWAMDQWYVGVDNGAVAVYSGLDVSVGPVSLSQLQERTDLEAVTLPEFDRAQVEEGIKATSREDAEAIVERLRTSAAACLSAPTEGCP